MKDTSFSKNINKNINSDRVLGMLCLSVGTTCFVTGNPFTGSNYTV